MPSIAVVLPAYNEEKTITESVRSFALALPDAAIFVVNNNSCDRTRELAIEAIERSGGGGGVIDEPRQGKGNALRRAFHAIDADVYLLADADLTYPADRAGDLIAPILDGRADMVVGDRGQVVPVPGSMILLGSGLLGLVGYATRKRKNK